MKPAISLVFLTLLTLMGMRDATAGEAYRPHILFILADDLGWSDLGVFGHAYHQTPHIDQLGRSGMRFDEAYAPAPICSASRAAILTGRTPARLHFEFVTKDGDGRQDLGQPLQAPSYPTNLPLAETTLAEVLAGAGYRTAFFGKWHLNQHHNGYLGWSPTHGPLQQGFSTGNADFGSHPYSYYPRGDRGDLSLNEGEYPKDSLTDHVIEFLEQSHSEPFFLYWSHYFVHDPVHTRCRWLLDRYRKQLPADVPDNRVAYAAMVETLDHQVGRVLRVLDEQGLAETTLVVFMSDNGGHPNHTGNGPLRGSKWNLYEGGIRVPLIARWPGKIASGTSRVTRVHGCDLLPTFAEFADATLDSGTPIDGMSLAPLLLDSRQEVLDPRPLIWHFPFYHPEKGFRDAPSSIGINDFVTSQTRPHSALRLGSYKLIHFDEDNRDELYDLDSDVGESHNLSAELPQLTRQLRERLQSELQASSARSAERSQ